MLPMIWPPPFDLLSQCCALHLRLSSPDPSGAEHVWQHSARSPQPKNQYREDLSLITWLCKHHCHLCCACLQSLPAEWSGQGTSRYKRPPPGLQCQAWHVLTQCQHLPHCIGPPPAELLRDPTEHLASAAPSEAWRGQLQQHPGAGLPEALPVDDDMALLSKGLPSPMASAVAHVPMQVCSCKHAACIFLL